MALFLEFLAQEWLLATALLVMVAMLLVHERRKAGPTLSPQQAINLTNSEQGIFLDLRDAADYRTGHIAGALHIPAGKIGERMAELEKYRDRPIVLVCKMGQQSSAAAKQLRTGGFSRVHRMSGGMTEWSNQQLPVVAKA